MRRKIKLIIFFTYLSLLTLLMVVKYNISKIQLTPDEIGVLIKSFGDIEIKDFLNILKINKTIITQVKYEFNPSSINVTNIVIENKGYY